MPTNRTLYVADADQPLWERAARLAERNRQSLSTLVAIALTKHVSGDHKALSVFRTNPNREERFEGRWLAQPDMRDQWEPQQSPRRFTHADEHPGEPLPPESWRAWIGETVRGRIVIYIHHWNHEYDTTESFEVFESLQDANAKFRGDPRIPPHTWQEAASKLRVSTEQVHWLDI